MKFSLHKASAKRGRPAASGPGFALRFAALAAVAGLVATVLVAVVLDLRLNAAQRAGELPDWEAALADGVADHVDAAVRRYEDALAIIVRDPTLPRLLQTGDRNALAAAETALAQLLPFVLRVRLLPPGVDQADANMSPPLGFAALEMLRSAEQGHAPAPEAHLAGSPEQQLNLVGRILREDGDTLAGLLLMSVDLALLQQSLERLRNVPGFIELQQRVGTRQVVLAARGDTTLRRDPPSRMVPLPRLGWQLSYWAADMGMRPDLALRIQFWVLLLVLAGAFAALSWLLFRRLEQLVDADLGRLSHWFEARSHGNGKRPPADLQLTAFRDAAIVWTRFLDQSLLRQVEAAVDKGKASPEGGMTVRVLGSRPAAGGAPAAAPEPAPAMQLPASIFRAYDIRGVVGETLGPDLVYELGRAIGSEAYERGEQTVIVGRDGRVSGPELAEALRRGLLDTGRDVIDIGMVPTPVLYFATEHLSAQSGVMLTGSHNPAEYNGLKVVLGGETLSGEAIQRLRERIEQQNFMAGKGKLAQQDILGDYLERIVSDVSVGRPLKVVIDCGNGVASVVAPALFHALGCEVLDLYCEVDGRFPNHQPDPGQPENLRDLIQAVHANRADLGLAFDGDGDRLGVVTSEGEIVWPDRQLMLFAQDLLSRYPGADIIFDVKCSRHLGRLITELGGRPLMWKTGHSLLKAKLRETGALLAGEMSGLIFFKERWYGFDDGLYAAARLLEILSTDPRRSAEVFAELPDSMNTPELYVAIADEEKFAFMERLLQKAQFGGGQTNTIDGLRVDFEDGWGLVRPSNTTPNLVLRFEANDELALFRIQGVFREQLLAVEPTLQLPF